MFSGIVEHLGQVVSLERRLDAVRLAVDVGPLAVELRPGDSVCVLGVCLTAVAVDGPRVAFDVITETLRCTTLGRLVAGDPVNLELALRVGERLGGHFVTGHVDGVGRISERHEGPGQVTLGVRCAEGLIAFLIPKGSIAVEGVSLTLVDLGPDTFRVGLIPHTLAVTTLGLRRPGDEVNLEADCLGKWVHRLLGAAAPAAPPAVKPLPGMSEDGLRGMGS